MLLANDGVLGREQIIEAGFVRDLATESPVNPGYGLGFRLGSARQLMLESEGSLLVATIGSGKASVVVGKQRACCGRPATAARRARSIRDSAPFVKFRKY